MPGRKFRLSVRKYQEKKKPLSLIVSIKLTKDISVLTVSFPRELYITCPVDNLSALRLVLNVDYRHSGSSHSPALLWSCLRFNSRMWLGLLASHYHSSLMSISGGASKLEKGHFLQLIIRCSLQSLVSSAGLPMS